jgi:hypothetical protein
MKCVRLASAICAGLLVFACVTPVSAHALAPKLFLSADGVALSSVPGKRVLKRSITVTRTTGKAAAAWTASSDEGWLTVTPGGATGDKLTVQADTRGLALDQVYTANVTVSTADGFTDTETLHVGLWVGSSATATVEVQQNALSIATNPVLPYAYVSDGGTDVKIFNVYKGTLVATFKNVANTVGYMDVSSDGATLFAVDVPHSRIEALDAANGTVLGEYPVGYQIDSYFNMVYARPYGQPALYLAPNGNGNGGVIAYPSGDVLLSGGFGGGSFLAATPDGRRVYTVTTFVSPGSITGYSLSADSGGISVKSLGYQWDAGSNCQDLAVSRDGKHVYSACGSPYEFPVFDGKTLEQVQTLPGDHYPNNAEVDTFGNFVGGLNGLYDPDDVFVYNQKGRSLGNVATTSESYNEGQQSAVVKVSGDSTRVVSSTGWVYNNQQTLIFRNMP